MPELPEVEVVRTFLDENLRNRTITKLECLYEPIIIDYPNFKASVEGKKIKEIKRYAKYLIFVLEDGAFLSHLRMEGKYFYVSNDEEIFKHVHVVFYLDNGYKLYYADVRKFGRMEYKRLEDIYVTEPIIKLGIEANNLNYDKKEIYQKIKNKDIPIKTILLDQTIISGLGNIYVDEVLFASKINPLRKGSSISEEEIDTIMHNSIDILTLAIKNKGTTIRSYTSSLGVKGEYQNFLNVHTKLDCPLCQRKLEKIKIGGRMSYFCNTCQR